MEQDQLPVEYPELEEHLPTILVDFIEHSNQRYDTVGDYYETADEINGGKVIDFKISKTKPHYEFLVLIHELIEWYLITCKGIKIEDIDAFDKKFEEMRSQYPEIVGDKEPGNDPTAPYCKEHVIATRMENWLMDILKISLKDYEEAISGLNQKT